MEIILLLIIAFCISNWIFRTLKRWKELPPGPWGFPILGYLPFLDQHNPQHTLTELSKCYGPIYSLKMGSVTTVVLADHKLVREAFSKAEFNGRAPLSVTHGIMKGNGIIAADELLWKDQRKLLMANFRSIGIVKHSGSQDKLAKRISSGAHEMIKIIKEFNGAPIDVSDVFHNSLSYLTSDIIFGLRFPLNDKTWMWFKYAPSEIMEEISVAGGLNFLPFLRFLTISAQKSMQFLTNSMDEGKKVIAAMISRRRSVLGFKSPVEAECKEFADVYNADSEDYIKIIGYRRCPSETKVHYFNKKTLIPSNDKCILDHLLIEQKKRYEEGGKNSCFLRDEQLFYLLSDIYGATVDSASISFSWILLFMALYTEEQDKVRKEILTVYPEDCEIDISKLPYLMATINETQRVRTNTPLGLPHGCTQDAYIGKYKIPKGTMVLPLQWAIHMDPNVWEHPGNFNPSRFIDERGELLKPPEFIPFQSGKRMCPGDDFARNILANFAVRLLRSYKIRINGDNPTSEELKGRVLISLKPPKVTYICEPIE